jgi:pyruvate kinase
MNMPKTKIIATLGPSSQTLETLQYFAKHHVTIARLNFSHNTSRSHIDIAKLAHEAGMQTMIDLGGPKIRIAEIISETTLQEGWTICLENKVHDAVYPFDFTFEEKKYMTIPVRFEIYKYVEAGRILLLDDGKIRLEITKVAGEKVFAKVMVGGIIKSGKSINLPYSDVKVDFLTTRDKQMLNESLVEIRPEYVACSFVKSVDDLDVIRSFVGEILASHNIRDYSPKICVKLETYQVLEPAVLEEVVQNCDLMMIARGDMALETLPAHILVPKYQDLIAKICQANGKSFVVATEALDSMITKPTPSRAEISDIYRSIVIDKADYIMLSGESAAGSYPKEAVSIMHEMIEYYGEK